ncbi:hypothetical protein PV325_012427, partial [Microctonus aethiopoides]
HQRYLTTESRISAPSPTSASSEAPTAAVTSHFALSSRWQQPLVAEENHLCVVYR